MDSKTRFSNRVEDYVKYRPHYPAAIIPFLEKEYGLSHDQPMADIGAGTGISAAMFLQEGYEVYAVEPNTDMLSKAVELLQQYPAFHAVDGTAENTDCCVTICSTCCIAAASLSIIAFGWVRGVREPSF